jgi:succinate dehydrogenase / fumarate reductase cytochrome b subunit
MANIFTTSIGKKVIMSLSGLFLILFLTLHAVLNGAYLLPNGAENFNAVCEFMSLGIIKVMVPVLAFGFFIHILYAFILYLKDYKARGKERYAVTNKTNADMASKNMVVLGLLVLVGIALHLTDFWAKMQLQEFLGGEPITGAEAMTLTFSRWWVYALYIVWFIILWFHLTHGFWSAFQSMGWNNDKWLKRLQWIGYIYATILVLLFIAVATKAFVAGNCPLA